MLLAILHTVAVAVYLGGTVFLAAVLIPVLRRRGLDADGLHLLAGALRIFHPISLGSLGVLVITGAVALTPLKEGLGPEYMSRLFGVLALKLFLVFVLVLVSSYQFFALGPRLFRALSTEEGNPEDLPSMQGTQLVQRIQRWNLVAAALGAVILYLGLRMGRLG